MKLLRLAELAIPTVLLFTTVAAQDGFTNKHEAGRCAMRGQCGKVSIFDGEVPCADNGRAEEPTDQLREKLVEVCGETWASGSVCCDDEQVEVLKVNFGKVEPFIASCPACKANFVNLFCTFTCSPNQSIFVNVTDTTKKDDKILVTELDNLWSTKYADGFYNSCKDVKFGAANTRAMSFIGGGATNSSQFLKFLGDHRPLIGSPFQINFPGDGSGKHPNMKPVNDKSIPCSTEDARYRCSCVDCERSCPELPEVSETEYCHVGAWPCLSFAIVLVYALLISAFVAGIVGHVAYRKHAQNKTERLRLLQDAAMSEDEDEDPDIVYRPSTWNRPLERYWLNTLCCKLFGNLGRGTARFPALTIGSSIIIVGLLSIGWARFSIETDPVRLWVPPDSPAAEEKTFFDEHFGPFYRTEQVFLVNDTKSGSVLNYETLLWWSDVEARVSRMKSLEGGYNLDDVCFKPSGDYCAIPSVTGYFQGDFGAADPHSWQDKIVKCATNPADIDCLPLHMQPLQPHLILGGWKNSVLDAQALITTWVVQNHPKETEGAAHAASWEESLKDLLLSVQFEAKLRGLRLSYSTEISLEEELNKSTNTDAKIVVISYVIMFIYASLALGSTTLSARAIIQSPSIALVQSKFMLGVIGILIVLLSVSASVGLFSAAGIPVTLIIAEVIPFLVLAVGVDNIFLITHEFERVNINYPDEVISERLGRALGNMGPSILLSATMETVAFALGAFVGMPAVRNFAAYAAGAVLINALLQVTMFVSVLALNQQRVEDGRADCVPCIQVRRSIDDPPDEDSLQRFIRRKYAPALLGKKAKVVIIAIFLGLFTAGLALLPAVELGLDQRIAIPNGSYLIDYFNDLYAYLEVGPPVYFVTRQINATARPQQQQLCGRFSSCNEFSLANVLEQERKRPNDSYIADATASWLDDYFLWLNPVNDGCCVDSKTGKPCFADRDPPWNINMTGLPEGAEFIHYLDAWLEAPTNEDCPLGGAAGYSTAVVPSNNSAREQPNIYASHFRTTHTPLHSQDDFISAYAAARRIASEIESTNPDLKVFPYSSFYIFFDQYSTIVNLTLSLLGAALGVCFIISTILLGSPTTAFVMTAVVAMILVDIGGCMALAGVSLNAVSLVNLVICVGIAVEFCAHIARAFMFPDIRLLDTHSLGVAPAAPGAYHTMSTPASGNGMGYADSSYLASTSAASSLSANPRGRDARAWAALSHVGGSVFSGITITKLLGVVVLAFTRSKIFEVYYFRVWLFLVVFAALHALVFLPVALSLVGAREGWAGEEDAALGRRGLREDLFSRRGGWGRDGVGDYTDDVSDDDY